MVGKHGAGASTETLGENDRLRRLEVDGRLHHQNQKAKKKKSQLRSSLFLSSWLLHLARSKSGRERRRRRKKKEKETDVDSVAKVAAVVDVKKLRVVSETATTDVRDTGHDVAGVVVGDVDTLLAVIEPRGPDSVGDVELDGRVGEILLQDTERQILGSPVLAGVVLEVSKQRGSKADVSTSVVGQIDDDPVETLLGSSSKAIIESLFFSPHTQTSQQHNQTR